MRNNPGMAESTPASVVAALHWRYATKVFQADQQIPAGTWAALEEALVLSPSSFGLQPWKFLVIENPEVRKELLAKSWGQPQVTTASHFVVFATRTDVTTEEIGAWIQKLGDVQSTPPEALAPLKGMIEGFVGGMTVEARQAWNTRQVYIALGQFMTAAAMMGVDTCPMEGLDAAAYDEVLGLKASGYATVVACAAGYRSASDHSAARPKARYEASSMIEKVS
jgi:nitroreductase